MGNSDFRGLLDAICRLSFESTLHVDSVPADHLVRYTLCVLSRTREINLTAARSAGQAFEILVRPSLGVQATWPRDARPPRLAVDLGSGNGFPGVAVAVSWPTCDVLLVERRAKKARAIGACLEHAGIPNAMDLACDARELPSQQPGLLGAADLVTVRAVGPLDETTRLAAPLLRPGGRVVHWKKADLAAAERRAGVEAARALGLEVLPDVPQPAAEGILVVVRRPAA